MTPNPLRDRPTESKFIMITPNPATDGSVISFFISDRGHVTLRIYDTGGRLIASLADRIMDPGFYDEPVNYGTYGSGTYICVLQTPSCRSSLKFTVIKNR
jgi:hypothetical protein